MPHPEPLGDRGHGREGDRDERRGQQVRPQRDGPDRDELGQPGEEDVRRVAGRVGDAEDVGDRLHLPPVAERDPGQERPEIGDEGHAADDRRSHPHRAILLVRPRAAGS